MTLLKKIKKEAGIQVLFRIPFIIVSLIWQSILQRMYRKDIEILHSDLENIKKSPNLIHKLQFFKSNDKFEKETTLLWIERNLSNTPFYNLLENLLYIASYNINQDIIDRIIVCIDNDRQDSYYRFHPINKGKNDHWEWYLTPWQRAIAQFSFLLWDNRFRDHLMPIYNRYKEWDKEWIWFLLIGGWSNIYSVTIGKAFHSFNKFIIDGDDKSLKEYANRVKNVKWALNRYFENGIPMEGGIYGKFMLSTAIHLDGIHRKLGFKYKILDDDFVQRYADYLSITFFGNDGFETSGDSHFEIDAIHSPEVIVYFSKISDNPIFQMILDHYRPKSLYYRNIVL